MSVRSKLDSFDPKNVEDTLSDVQKKKDTLSDDGNIDEEKTFKV
jgi:hypothetical protein